MSDPIWEQMRVAPVTMVEYTTAFRWAYPNGSACLQQKVRETHYENGRAVSQTNRWEYVPHVHDTPACGWTVDEEAKP